MGNSEWSPTGGNGGSITYAGAPSGGDDSATIQAIINAVNAAGGGVVQLQAGTYKANLTMKSRVTVKGPDDPWTTWGYNASPFNYVTTTIKPFTSGTDIANFPTTCVAAQLANVLLFGDGAEIGVNLPATTNRNGNKLTNVYVNSASVGIYCGAAETRMEKILVLLCGSDGIQIDGLDCWLNEASVGYNSGNGIVVGSTGASNANVLRGRQWDVYLNTLDGIQLNGDAHRLSQIQSNQNNRRGLAFLTCTATVIQGFNGYDNGREYDGATHTTRYPDVNFAHPTASNTGCGIDGGKIYTDDGKQSYGVTNSEVAVSFPLLANIAFAGTYASGSNAADGRVHPLSNFCTANCNLVPNSIVPQAGEPGIIFRPNGVADQFQWTDGSLAAWGGVAANGSLYTKLVTLTYSATITMDASAGNTQKVVVTDANAITVAAPTNPPSSSNSQRLVLQVLNSSGGAMGAITWNAAFKFAGYTWTNPANGNKRQAVFEWNGLNWVCQGISAADF